MTIHVEVFLLYSVRLSIFPSVRLNHPGTACRQESAGATAVLVYTY
jgi:hypothetical protein